MNVLKSVAFAGFVTVVAGQSVPVSAARYVAASGIAHVDDDTIETRIAGNLKKSPTLAPRDIDVEVKEHVVTLTGTVRTDTEKARAARLARVDGVTRVINQIEVDPKVDESKIDRAGDKAKNGLDKAVDATVKAAKKTKEAVQKGVGKTEEGVAKTADKSAEALGKVGDTVGDKAVSTKVEAGLSGEMMLRDSAIKVDTANHIVTLRGTVPSYAAKARAVAIALDTDGVTRVVDEIVLTEQ